MNLQKCRYTWLKEDAFRCCSGLALDWVQRSFEVTGQQGSAGFYQHRPWERGKWSNAYPETTGYIIETLLDFEPITQTGLHRATAMRAADWLLTIQLENGAFQGGLIGSPLTPSVFNTGMILFGLERASREKGKEDNQFKTGMAKAANWLLEKMESDGSWQTGAYVPGYIPTYYTRVLWALLLVDRHLNLPLLNKQVVGAIEFYRKKLRSDSFINDCSFFPGKPALTHTIAYSLRGFLECALELKDETLLNEVKSVATKLASDTLKQEQLAGEYDADWRGNYSFTCLTGNAQLSIIFLKLFKVEQNELFLSAALTAFSQVITAQNTNSALDMRGAIPGSTPIWGKYFRFRYPNWGVKFYLDAWLLFQPHFK